MVVPEGGTYKAKRKYQDPRVAMRYEQTRFRGLLGRTKLWRDRALVARALRDTGGIRCLLDLPCGTGRFTPVLAKRAERVVSADISHEMIQVAVASFSSSRVSCVRCSVEGLPFRDASFDLTFTARFLLHLPAELREKAFSELARVSRRWVFFDCLMEGGLKGWLRGGRGQAAGQGRKAKKRMKREDLLAILDRVGLQVVRVYRPSRLFSEKWMVLCERKEASHPHG